MMHSDGSNVRCLATVPLLRLVRENFTLSQVLRENLNPKQPAKQEEENKKLNQLTLIFFCPFSILPGFTWSWTIIKVSSSGKDRESTDADPERNTVTYQIVDLSEKSFEELQAFAGHNDCNLNEIEKEFHVELILRSDSLKIDHTDPIKTTMVKKVIDLCFKTIEDSGELSLEDTARLCTAAKANRIDREDFVNDEPLLKARNGKLIYPKTFNQKLLCDAFHEASIIFASGVAGTGKTYLAVAYAVDQLKKEKVSRIVLTRPAVEAGESLGFLPGDMKEKVDPYLRPLYDALNEFLGADTVEKYIEKEVIEIAPLAFMRGRTLNDAVVILDEAQNTIQSQMKMFLTRMGKNAQMIINGDVSQIDLIKKKDSGLIQACAILQGIDGIEILYLDQSDVVRNPLVQKIIDRYAQYDL